MKVILNKDIPNLGEEGDIKDVARGYARNFLIPNSLVMPYTRDAIAILESRRERLDQRRVEKQKAALDIKTRLETEELILDMPAGDRGRLFGSVTSANIVDALAAQGITVERKRLEIPEKTIKSVGTTRVRVRLYGDEEAELKVIVRAVGKADGSGEPAAETSPEATPESAVNAEPEVTDAETEVADAAAEAAETEVADAGTEEPAVEADEAEAGESPVAEETETDDTEE